MSCYLTRRWNLWTRGTAVEAGISHIEDDFVQELERVAQEHQGHDAKVDPAAQGREINSFDGRGMSMSIEIFPRCIDLGRGVVACLSLSLGYVELLLGITPVVAVFL